MKWYHVGFVFCCCVLSSCAEVVKVKIEPLPPKSNDINSRIIGGTPANIEKYPFAVQVLYLNRLGCGGSLITLRHVLTAAHCFYNQNGNLISLTQFSVRAGTPFLESGGQVRTPSMLIIHEYYNIPLRDNDIAVMVLSSAFNSSISIGVATLPAPWINLPDNTTVWHIGWGKTSIATDYASPVLNEAQVYTINNGICASRYQMLGQLQSNPGQFLVTTNNLCSGILDVGGRDACQGDSGGPLVYNGNFVVGVTAWGYSCAEPMFPGVNMKTSAYTSWINATVAKHNSSGDIKANVFLLLTLISTMILTYQM